jgi:hypothetical protein
MVVMGLAPIGCAPRYMWEYGTVNGDCVEPINDMAIEFNFLMRYIVEKLAEELPDANIIFCDVYEGSMDILNNHERYGISISTFLNLSIYYRTVLVALNHILILLCFVFPY